MSAIDWIVLVTTLLFIVVYGVWKSRGSRNIESYLLADRKLPWYHIGLSVMATQASAITFLSGPGMGYSAGLRFVQFYFGLPLAMVILCITFIPIFHRLKVYTAYEYLENRFDQRTRLLTAFLFLVQRGLSTGITIYAPAIILSTILHIDIFYTIVFNGVIVIAYTVYGGTKAVSYTQVLQMSIIFAGLFLAAYLVIHFLPEDVGFSEALHIAGKMDHLKAIDTKFDINDRYNIWSGIIGGLFLQLSYFGTDQSQVGRYLTASSVTQSRLGLIMNGLVKIPMQFFILLIGVMVFTFYQFYQAPIFFNPLETDKLKESAYKEEFRQLELKHAEASSNSQKEITKLLAALKSENEDEVNKSRAVLKEANKKDTAIRGEVKRLMLKNDKNADVNDSNYVFLTFVTQQMPVGVVGLLIAIIFLAAMGSTASGLNSLASTTVVDFYKRVYKKEGTEKQYLSASRWATVIWGVFCIMVAFYAGSFDNLIEAVNVLGSLFYGTILGIFLVAFYMKQTGGKAVFIAACIAEAIVVYVHSNELMAFLWLNVVGCLLVMLLSWIIQKIINQRAHKKSPEF